MRRVPQVVLITAILALIAAALGLSLGRRAVPVSETQVIEAWAAAYVRETGGKATDCAASPDPRPDVWLVVQCGFGDTARVYPVDRNGELAVPKTQPAT